MVEVGEDDGGHGAEDTALRAGAYLRLVLPSTLVPSRLSRPVVPRMRR